MFKKLRGFGVIFLSGVLVSSLLFNSLQTKALDSSFESETGGWVSFAGEAVSISDESASDGEKSLKVTTNNWWGGAAYYNLELVAGTPYRISMDIKLSTLNEADYMVSLWPTGSDSGQPMASKTAKCNKNGFTTIVMDYTPAESTNTAMLLIRAAGSDFDTAFYLDNVSVKATSVTGHAGNPIPEGNLISDGSFEDDIVAASGFAGGTLAQYSDASFDGTKSVLVTTANWWDGICIKNLTFEAGKSYTIKAHGRYSTTTANPINYKLSLYSTDQDSSDLLASDTKLLSSDKWTEFSITYTPSAQVSGAMLLLRSTGGESGSEHYPFLADGFYIFKQQELPSTVVTGHAGNPVPNENLIEGGSFENGVGAARKFVDATVTETSLASYDGGKAIRVATTNWWDGVCFQQLQLQKGKTYVFAAYARYADTTSESIDYELSLWPSNSDMPSSAKLASDKKLLKSSEWVKYTITFSAEKDMNEAMLLMRSTGGPNGDKHFPFYVDCVTMEVKSEGEIKKEIIKNGSFEEGNSGVGFASGKVERSKNVARSGEYSLRVTTENWWDGVAFQNLKLEKGKTYVFTAYVRLEDGVDLEHKLSLFPTNSDQPNSSLLASGKAVVGKDKWTKLTFTYTCDKTSDTYMLLIRSTGGEDGAQHRTFYVDDVSAEQVNTNNPKTGETLPLAMFGLIAAALLGLVINKKVLQ